MNQGKRIKINLQETDTQEFQSENLIQSDAKESFSTLIGKFIEDIEINKNKDDGKTKNFKRVHNTILINGKRGMGKTSFILSMKDDDHLMEKLCPLEIIDPTLIETKEHVFLNIITLIKYKVEEHIKCQYCDNKSSLLKNWKESLRSLSGGLSMLDNVGSNHLQESMWDSPELILEKGLSNAKQGANLEKNFHKFIDESLKVLNKQAFFLILDDIDTSLDKGADILEILRKYLTSPKLIIAMLGDIDLYSTLVRQLQWEKMDPKKILKRYEGIDKYLPQIEHLEEQYLTKVLKPENRIDLKNLFELENQWLITDEHKKLLIQKQNNELDNTSLLKLNSLEEEKTKKLHILLDKEKDITEPLSEFVSRMIKDVYWIENDTYLKYYKRLLLKQSTRSVLQILQVWITNKKLDDNFIFRIKHTFYTILKKELESYSLLEIQEKAQFVNLLSMYILQKGIERDNHLKLIPEFPKDQDNLSMFFINALANDLLKPNDYLSYFIKIGYALERFSNLDIETHDEENLEYQKFIGHIALDSGESSSKIAKRLLSTFKIDSNTHTANPIFFGNLSLSATQLSSIQNGSNLSLLLSRVYNPKGGSYNFISFFNLIGILTDISGKSNTQIESILTKNNLIREFYIFDKNLSVKEDEGNKDVENESFDITETLKNELIEWSSKVHDINQPLPLFILAKIWVRIVYTFNNIENKNENRKKNYLELLNLYIAGFLNAVYVELELYKAVNRKLDIKNPNTDSNYFSQKLQKDNYKINDANYTLFDYLYECPVFKSDIFSNLENIKLNINYSSLHKEIKLEEIKRISNWKNKAVRTIVIELRKNGFSNVQESTVESLLKEMKPSKEK